MKKINAILGVKLKELREAKGLSIREVGERVHKSNVSISHYETGRNAIDIETLKKLCLIYDKDMIKFLAEIYAEI